MERERERQGGKKKREHERVKKKRVRESLIQSILAINKLKFEFELKLILVPGFSKQR